MKKIGELNTKFRIFTIYHDEKDRYNPYKVYEKYWDHGWHKKLLVKYGHLASCTAYLHSYVMDHDEE